MKKTICTGILLTAALAAAAAAQEGMVLVHSSYSVATTLDRLESDLAKKGMTVFTRISHSAGAKNAGLSLRPTELLIFGNPDVGTKLMQCAQTSAIDLPLKALAYQDETGRVWLAYNDPAYIARRHNAKGCDEVIGKMTKGMSNFAAAATK